MGELGAEQRKWEAWLSYWPNPAIHGKGDSRTAVPFDEWWGLLTTVEEEAVTEITDEELEAALKAGRQGLRPPGM